ncbi:hypothetical protein GCM10009111_32830 [Colwellia asteriadis]|uniref:N-acetyltransferase domain-containing protein n=1 Tax=Colwellia asteriadis TaxID=517723 RepID=A0ABN1LAT9_9GAMM
MNACRSPESAIEFKKYYQLRYQVLRQPWHQPLGSEQDELEDRSIHRMIINHHGEVLAVGRLEAINEQVGQIRYMAVAPQAQGQGLGQEIISHLEQQAKAIGLKYIKLNARELAVSFYAKLGYQQQGFVYQLFDDINHYAMTKVLK